MLEQRNIKIDLLALGLLATVVFLAAALLSYDPADPPSHLVFPPHSHPVNICGRSGAIASRLLFQAFGLGAYYLVVSLGVLDAVLLIRRAVSQPWLRAIGWLLSLVGVATLAGMAAPGLSPGPVIGAGGYLGATARAVLQTQFASMGAYIITVSMIAGGLLLCTDYHLIRLLAWAIGRPTRSLGRGMLRVGAAYSKQINPRRSDLDNFPREVEAVTVRQRGRGGQKPAATAAETSLDESPSAGKPAVKENGAVATLRKAFGSRVGISHPPKVGKKDHRKMLDELDESDLGAGPSGYELPSLDLLLEGEKVRFEEQEKEVLRKAKILEKTFLDFGFHIRVVEIQTGPVIAQFEVELEAGLRLSRITGLADDLAIALRVPSVRIVAPLPGKNTVGIEVPNNERQVVRLREVMEEAHGKTTKMRIPIYLGKDVAGAPLSVDLSSLPHLLIAGRTGTGKSVCLNSIIVSMIMTRRPDEVRMLMIDPKMVELSPYKCLPHLMHPVVTDMRKAEAILGWAVEKMEERYHLLARAGVRHISVYNQLGEDELMERIQPETEEDRKQVPSHMPYIVIVADELADLMMTAAKEVESHIIRLAQKSRAVGIHLVLATQKPTVDVITGLIKSNLPARIAFQVASRTDSRVVLDEMGADKLLGNGDMLFLWPGTSTLLRGQGTYLTDDEISRVIGAVATSEPQFVNELVQLQVKSPSGETKGTKFSDRDELYESAIDMVIREGRGSVSLLQRALGIGYGRAARLIDFMAEDGIVGPYNGSQAREILISLQKWEEMSGQAPSQAAEPSAPRRSNRILLDSSDDRSQPPAGPAQRRNQADADDLDDQRGGRDEMADDPEEYPVVKEPANPDRNQIADRYFDDQDEAGQNDRGREVYGLEGEGSGKSDEARDRDTVTRETKRPKLPPPNSRWKAESA